MKKVRIAVAGCGFWANYQVAAWKEIEGVEIVAVADKDAARLKAFQDKFNTADGFDDVELMLQSSRPDILDVISSSDAHGPMVRAAIKHHTSVICQKPLAPTWHESKALVELSKQAGVPLHVHENWRFQAPIRKVKDLLDQGVAGDVFRARITCSHAFPVFENQPFLKGLEQMVIADLGVHLLDAARYLFGEADYLYAQVSRVTPGIRGEDVATILITFSNGCRCIVELSVATRQETPHFPQTLIHIEGKDGVITLKENYQISVITDKVSVVDASPRQFRWVHPDYAVVQTSIYDCNKSILEAIVAGLKGETSGSDNLETLRLAYASYASAEQNAVIHLKHFH